MSLEIKLLLLLVILVIIIASIIITSIIIIIVICRIPSLSPNVVMADKHANKYR